MRRPCSGRARSSVPPSTGPRGPFLLPSALCLSIVSASVLCGASPASAHTSLVSSSPAADAVVDAPVEVVTLVFDEPVSPRQIRMIVTGPGGADVADGPARVSGGTVTRAVGAWPTGGSYRLAYRVLAEDGHPIAGQVPFQVRLPAATVVPPPVTTADRPPATDAAQPAQASRQDGSTGVAPALFAGLVGVGAVLVAGAVRAARRSPASR